MKFALFLFVGVCCTNLYAQMGIGTETPDAAAELDIKSEHRGLLIPRINLSGSTDQSTITAGNVESLVAFNTTYSSTLTPGYYYWYDGKWNRLMTPADLPDNRVFWDVNQQQFTYIDENGELHEISLTEGNETLTTLALNPDGKTLEYTDENSDLTEIDLGAVVQNTETLTTIEANDDDGFIYTDEIGGETSISLPDLAEQVKIVTQDYSLENEDRIILGNAHNHDITITLPDPGNVEGKRYTIRKQDDNEDYFVNVTGNIAGIPTGEVLYTALPFTGWDLVSDGTEWHIVNKF